MPIMYDPQFVSFDNQGVPLVNGRYWFYAAGTTDLKNVYLDEARTVPATNPLPLLSNGRLPYPLHYDTGYYKILLEKQINFNPPPVGSDPHWGWSQIYLADWIDGDVAGTSSASTGSCLFVGHVALLRSVDTTLYTFAYAEGGASTGDGGSGFYRWISTSTAPDDNGWTLQPAAGGTGRWVRCLDANQTGLDIRIWGAMSGTGPIDSYYAAASAVSVQTKLPVVLPAGTWLFNSSNITLTGAYLTLRILQNAVIGFTSATAGNLLTFSCPTDIQTTSQMFQTSDAATATFKYSVGSVPFVRPEWCPATTYVKQIGSACSNTLPVKVGAAVTYAGPSGVTFVSKVIFDGLGSFSISGGTATFLEGVDVEGPERQALSFTSPGDIQILGCTIDATWFGWGSLDGYDQGPALNAAINSAISSNGTVYVPQIGWPMCISSHVLAAASRPNNVSVIVDGSLSINTGCQIYIPCLQAPRRLVFMYFASDANMVSLGNSDVFPEWFGAQGNGSTDDTIPLNRAISSLYAYPTPGTPRWVSGNGASYATTATTYVAVSGVCLRDMSIVATTSAAAAVSIVGSARLYGNKLRNVNITHNNSGNNYPALSLNNIQNFVASECYTTCYNSTGVWFSNTSFTTFKDCIYSLNSVSYFMSEDTTGTIASINLMNNCFVSGLNSGNYTCLSPNMSKYTDCTFVNDGITEGKIIIAGPGTDNTNRTTVDVEGCSFYGVDLDVSMLDHVKVTNCGGSTTASVIHLKPVTATQNVNYVWIHHNDMPVNLDTSVTGASLNLTPAAFMCYISNNDNTSGIRTHGHVREEATIDATTNLPFSGFIPGAPIVAFNMDMLATNSSDTNYGYSCVCQNSLDEHVYGVVDVNGRAWVKATNAGWDEGHDRDWIQWSAYFATSVLAL